MNKISSNVMLKNYEQTQVVIEQSESDNQPLHTISNEISPLQHNQNNKKKSHQLKKKYISSRFS